MTEGGSHHSVCEVNTKWKIKRGVDKKPETLADRFADVFNTKQKEIPKKEWKYSGEKKDSVIRRGRILQTQYGRDVAPLIQPDFAEKRVTMRVGVVDVVGVIDVGGKWGASKNKQLGMTKGRGLMDYKVVGKAMSRVELENMISLSFYGWNCLSLMPKLNLTKNPPDVGFCMFKKTTDPVIQWQSVKLDIARVRWFRHIVLSVADAISRGAFPVCNPCDWWCSPKFCGYYGRCKGKIK